MVRIWGRLKPRRGKAIPACRVPNLTPRSSRGSASFSGETLALECHQAGRGGSPVPGNAMNLALSIALYASLCKAQGLPLRFPGSEQAWHSIVDHTDAGLLAEATLWAAASPAAQNQAFNVNNGDIWRWSELWPRIARWFELDSAPPVSLSFHQLFNDYRGVWRELAEERLVEADILQLSDGHFADFVFGWNYDMFGDGSKLRRAGFTQMQATDEMFFSLFAQLRAARIIP
jgi:hypothetical protein